MRTKLILMFMLIGVSLVLPNSFAANSFADDGAFGQLEDAADSSGDAADSNSLEDARDTSGYTFDTPDNSPPVVDLSGAGENPTPELLRNEDGSNPYTPEEYRTVRPGNVPPLP